jgi:Flp pilus assembly protein TadG
MLALLRDCAGPEGSQIVELAVSLPLLLIITVGITDFGSAFILKQTLNNAAREGVRVASNQTMLDVTNATPNSIVAIRDGIRNYLVAANVSDCGLGSAQPTKSGLTWTYTASPCANGTLTVTIDRGNTFSTGGNPSVVLETTHVNISYPYQWSFGRVMSLILPANYATGVTPISTDAVMATLN